MILERKDIERIHRIITDSGFRPFVPIFIKLLRWSRFPILKHKGFFVLVLQLMLLKYINRFEETIREREGKIQDPIVKEKNNLKREIDLSQEIIRILKSIADGIAWRNLSFRRPLLVLLSQNESHGRVDAKYPGLKKILGSKDVILINDITRFLRTGDLTAIYKGGRVIIYEMKKSGQKISNLSDVLGELQRHKRMPTAQEMRHWVAQKAIMENKIWSPVFEKGEIVRETEVEIIDLNFSIQTHARGVQRLIKDANKSGYAGGQLEEGLYVRVMDYEVMTERKPWNKVFEEFKKDDNNKSPDWLKNKITRKIFINTHEGFFQKYNEFARGMTPPAILPFRAKDCARIITGQLYITIYLNIDYLKSRIERLGWQIKETKPPQHKSRVDFFANLKTRRKGPIEPLEHESIFFLSRDGKKGINLPWTIIMIMLSSFYKTDFILDFLTAVERDMLNRNYEGKLFEFNFPGERKVFV